MAHFSTMEAWAHLLVAFDLAKHHRCWPLVTRIPILANIPIRMLTTAEIIAVEVALVVVSRLVARL